MRKLILLFLLINTLGLSAETKNKVYPIAFYNLENLFDTQKDPRTLDDDFTPTGKYQWTEDKYQKKLNNLSDVISQLGKSESPSGIALLGVAEVENLKVMQDLINTGDLAKKNYKIVHYDSPDARGIDVGLIYDPQVFVVGNHKIYPFTIPGTSDIKTRDILVVSGTLAGEPLSILVNHWPSRRGESSSPLRERAGEICKHITDSIYKRNPKTAIVVMGDFNDDPQDKSTSVALGAKKNEADIKQGELFNPMWNVLESGIGTLQYRGKWNLFDQIIISESLLKNGKSKLQYIKPEVFNKDFLIQQSGNFKGYPLRTFSGNTFLNGYSDHFPTLIYLTK